MSPQESTQRSASVSESIVMGVLAALALAPPGFVVSLSWEWVRQHPWVAALAVAVYWVLLGVVTMIGRVGRDVADRWVKRLADRVDQAVSALVMGHRRVYLRKSKVDARDLELQGVATLPAFTPWLAQIYADVSLDPRATNSLGEDLRTRWERGRRRPLDYFLSREATGVFTIAGYPGSGKTSLLRHAMATRCERRFLRRRELPVLLYLRDHVDSILDETNPVGIADLAVSVPWLTGKVPASWLQRRLEKEKCLVMFDGLDEVGDAVTRRRVAEWMYGQIKQHESNMYVITSRPHGYDDNVLRNTTRLHIRGFTVDQVGQFIRRWYYEIERRADVRPEAEVRDAAALSANDLLERLRRRPALHDLASNPLLLTMIANVHKYRGALPGSRAELYREMCEMLLVRRREETGVINPVMASLTTAQRSLIVTRLALAMMDSRVRDIEAESARNTVDQALQRIPADVTAADVLTDLVEGGMLIVRRPDTYAFPHLTLQEYMASMELSQNRRVDLLAERVDDPWWRETLLLWTESRDASDVIEACLQSTSIHALSLAFECAERPREIDPRLHTRLNDLLQAPLDTDDSGRALVAAVKISHDLHEVISLGDGLAVCARPVNNALWGLYEADLRSNGYRPAPDDRPHGPPDAAVRGVSRWDAERFIDWVNSFFDDGTAYRLPTVGELREPATSMAVDMRHSPVWAVGRTGVVLHCNDLVDDPRQVKGSLLTGMVRADRKSTGTHLLVALAYYRASRSTAGDFLSRFDHALDFERVFGFATSHDEGTDTDPHLSRALNYVLARIRLLDGELPADLGSDGSLARVMEADMVGQFTRRGLLPEKLGKIDRMVIRAYLVMAVMWLDQATTAWTGQALTDLDAHLAKLVTRSAHVSTVESHHVIARLRRAERLVRQGADDGLRALVARVIDDAVTVTTPFLSRRGPYDTAAAEGARMALVAATAAVERFTRSGTTEVLDLLRGAIHSMYLLQARVDQRVLPSEMLLLARA